MRVTPDGVFVRLQLTNTYGHCLIGSGTAFISVDMAEPALRRKDLCC